MWRESTTSISNEQQLAATTLPRSTAVVAVGTRLCRTGGHTLSIECLANLPLRCYQGWIPHFVARGGGTLWQGARSSSLWQQGGVPHSLTRDGDPPLFDEGGGGVPPPPLWRGGGVHHMWHMGGGSRPCGKEGPSPLRQGSGSPTLWQQGGVPRLVARGEGVPLFVAVLHVIIRVYDIAIRQIITI